MGAVTMHDDAYAVSCCLLLLPVTPSGSTCLCLFPLVFPVDAALSTDVAGAYVKHWVSMLVHTLFRVVPDHCYCNAARSCSVSSLSQAQRPVRLILSSSFASPLILRVSHACLLTALA